MLDSLVRLGRFVGAPENNICILAEGNVSCVADDDSFWVKASGCSLRDCQRSAFVRVRFEPIRDAIKGLHGDALAVRRVLNDARCEDVTEVPSTETYMHAALLRMPGVRYVAHGHPPSLLSILSLQDARDFASRRLFPDEIVCCGPETCYVAYVAPGIELARSIVSAANDFRQRLGIEPRTYWLQNHGLIAVGETVSEVESALKMSVKAGCVLLAALGSGKPIRWLTKDEVDAIYNWPDEHYRQAKLRQDQ